MIQDIIRYKLDYSLLSLVAVLYIVFFLRFQANPQILVFGTVIFGIAYFFWGVFHHLHTHTFHAKVMLEYLLVSIFSVLLVATLLI